jgi:hypothetical protein
MTATPALGSILLGSADPARLREWYQAVFGLDVPVVHRPELPPRAVEPQRMVPIIVVADAADVESRLIARDTVWVRELETGPWGIIGTVLDPDGNLVQFIERVDQDRQGTTR